MKNESRIREVISWKIKKNLNIKTAPELLSEVIEDITLSTAEKIHRGDLTLKKENEVISYLVTSGWWCYRRKLEKLSSSRVVSGYRLELEESVVDDDAAERAEVEQELSRLYDEVFNYVFDSYEFIEAAVFKCYVVNKYTSKNERRFTYDKLEEMSGFSRAMCCSIVKKIRNDLKKNRPDLNPFNKNK